MSVATAAMQDDGCGHRPGWRDVSHGVVAYLNRSRGGVVRHMVFAKPMTLACCADLSRRVEDTRLRFVL